MNPHNTQIEQIKLNSELFITINFSNNNNNNNFIPNIEFGAACSRTQIIFHASMLERCLSCSDVEMSKYLRKEGFQLCGLDFER